jgi:nucleoside-diphosphate-sugar epimerase
MMSKRVLIFGANGMIGSLILEKCLESEKINEVVAITRKELEIKHPKLKNILHQDYLNVNSIENYFENIDICYFCLGVYTGAVNNDLFFEITVDYTKTIASKLIQKSNQACFCFLSGMGADLTEKSKMPFAKAKGMAENYLLKLGLQKLVIFRPGYIYPDKKRKEPNFFYTLSRWLYPILKIVYPNIGLSSETLANVMFNTGFSYSPKVILENKDIKDFNAS